MHDMDGSRRAEIEAFIRDGNLISAIKRYREATGVDLKTAKEAVDAIANGRPVPLDAMGTDAVGGRQTDAVVRREIEALLYANKTIDAIKRYREATGCGLKDAKTTIDAIVSELRAQHPERFAPSAGGCGAACCVIGVTGGLLWLLFM